MGNVDPLRWRFYLRKGVKFHNGEAFTADDVVFSLDRMRSPGSQIKSRAPADMKAVKVDDHTVDFVLASPNPILHAEWDTWYMFSKGWAEANGATQAQAAYRDRRSTRSPSRPTAPGLSRSSATSRA